MEKKKSATRGSIPLVSDEELNDGSRNKQKWLLINRSSVPSSCVSKQLANSRLKVKSIDIAYSIWISVYSYRYTIKWLCFSTSTYRLSWRYFPEYFTLITTNMHMSLIIVRRAPQTRYYHIVHTMHCLWSTKKKIRNASETTRCFILEPLLQTCIFSALKAAIKWLSSWASSTLNVHLCLVGNRRRHLADNYFSDVSHERDYTGEQKALFLRSLRIPYVENRSLSSLCLPLTSLIRLRRLGNWSPSEFIYPQMVNVSAAFSTRC